MAKKKEFISEAISTGYAMQGLIARLLENLLARPSIEKLKHCLSKESRELEKENYQKSRKLKITVLMNL